VSPIDGRGGFSNVSAVINEDFFASVRLVSDRAPALPSLLAPRCGPTGHCCAFSIHASHPAREKCERKTMAGEMRSNGETDALPAAPDGPQLFVNLQYIKDFSFENPRAPQSLIQQPAQPEVAINVDVKAQNLNPEAYEVVLTINVTAQLQEEPVFLVELAYAAVVTIRNAPEPLLANLILVETPRIIFPFARAVIANATRDGGFPPLMINPIDFAELLRRQQPPERSEPGDEDIAG
jgi:preprotein translocase subunit SecB